MKKLWSVLILVFSFYFISAQTSLQIEWDKTFGDKKNQSATSVIQNNNYELVLGGSKSVGVGWLPWLIKTDNQGNLIQENSPRGVYIHNYCSVIQTSDNGYATLGFVNSTDENTVSLLKYSSSLSNQWQKSFGKSETNYGMDVIKTKDGGFMLLSNSSDFEDKYSINLYKINSSGNQQWTKTYHSQYMNFGNKIIQTKNEAYVIVGKSQATADGFADLYALKVDKNGNLKWEFSLEGAGGDEGVYVIEANDGGYLIGGNTSSYGAGWVDAWVVKVDENGNKIWNKTFGGRQSDELSTIVSEGAGYIIVGSTKSSGAGDWDYWIFRIDNVGNLIWEKTFGGSEEEKAKGMTKTFDGGLAVVGHTKSKGAGKKDLWLVKLNFSIRDRATEYVETRINDWQKKGRYEKLEDYQIRVTIHTRQQKITALTDTFFRQIGNPIFDKDIKLANLDYDTESEVFRISLTYYNPMYVPVPIDEAPAFEDNFSNLTFTEMKYNLTTEDKLEIYQSTITNPNNEKVYFYDASKPIVFNSIVVVNDFDPIDITPEPTNDPTIDDNTVVVGQSDVDVNIPDLGKTNNDRYALIIGNSHYIEHGSDMVDILFSINDAKFFKEYCVKVLGVPDNTNHIYYIEDANATYIKLYIDNFAKLIQSKPAGSEFYVYYSGHGTQDDDGESYLVPVGVKSDYISTFGIKLADFYSQINPGADKKVAVFVDACFSGGGKSGQLLVNAKTGLYRPQNNTSVSSNLMVFAASSEKEISQEYLEKHHGLFTYYLLKTLQDSKGDLTYGELFDRISNDVNTTTLNPQNGFKAQTPNVNVNPAIQNTWRTWEVNE